MPNLRVVPRVQVGTVLPNGALVLAVSWREQFPNEGTVLAFAKDSVEPFVTWAVFVQSDGRIETVWGHYYAHVDTAVTDYGRRVAGM